MAPTRYLIVGGDAAGMSAAMQIKRRDPAGELIVLERGDDTSYAACGIPYWLAGDVADLNELAIVTPEEFRKRRGVDVRTRHEAVALDAKAQIVTARTPDGEATFAYDRLLLATGARPILPDWPGRELKGVTPLRNLADARHLEALLSGARTLAVIGGGYVGLEVAEGARRRGLNVVLLEKQNALLGGLDPDLHARLAATAAAHGIDLRMGVTVTGFVGDEHLVAVATDSGEVACDVAIVALGVRPNSELAAAAGVCLGAGGAIAINERMATNIDGIWAAGDCAEALHVVHRRPVYVPLALGANRGGRVAGTVMAGGDEVFPGIAASAVTKLYDLAVGRTGLLAADLEREGLEFAVTHVQAPARAGYMRGATPIDVKLYYRPSDGRVWGALMWGMDASVAKRTDVLAVAATLGLSVEQVAALDLTYAPPFGPVWDPVLAAANKAAWSR